MFCIPELISLRFVRGATVTLRISLSSSLPTRRDSSLRHSLKCLSGFQKTLLRFSLLTVLYPNKCYSLLIDGASESSRWDCSARKCASVPRVSTASLFEGLIDRRVFGFSAAPKRWARFHGNLTGWPRSSSLLAVINVAGETCKRPFTYTHAHTHTV